MRRLVVALALGAALGLGAGASAASAQGYGYATGYTPGIYPGYGLGPYPSGPYGSGGGYVAPPGYGGSPYGGYPGYVSQVATGLYNQTGSPTFGFFPYLQQLGSVAGGGSPYSYYSPYAFFLGCTNTYSGSAYYVCR
jgi:hypothetical protein